MKQAYIGAQDLVIVEPVESHVRRIREQIVVVRDHILPLSEPWLPSNALGVAFAHLLSAHEMLLQAESAIKEHREALRTRHGVTS